jgi:hypothetical protein
MNECPFRTEGCSLSRPCHKCRLDSTRQAHVLVRFDARGTRRQPRHTFDWRTHYGEIPPYREKMSA